MLKAESSTQENGFHLHKHFLHGDDDARCHCTRVRYCSSEILRKEDSKISQRKGGKSRGIFQHPDSSHISVKILRKKMKKRWGKKDGCEAGGLQLNIGQHRRRRPLELSSRHRKPISNSCCQSPQIK